MELQSSFCYVTLAVPAGTVIPRLQVSGLRLRAATHTVSVMNGYAQSGLGLQATKPDDWLCVLWLGIRTTALPPRPHQAFHFSRLPSLP